MTLTIYNKTSVLSVDKEFDLLRDINRPIKEFDSSCDISEPITDSLRIILEDDANASCIESISEFAKQFKRVRVVFTLGNNNEIWRSFNSLENLYGVQFSGINKENYNILNCIPSTICGLELGFESVPKEGISFFNRFKSLRSLTLSGKFKGIEGLCDNEELRKLSLYYVSNIDLGSLSQIYRIKKILINHGSATNIDSWRNFNELTELSLWRVKGLNTINWIQSAVNLKNLELGALSELKEIPNLGANQKLKSVKLESLKNLLSIKSLSKVNSMESLHLEKMNQLPMEEYNYFISHPLLKELTDGYSSNKKSKEVIELLGLPYVQYKLFANTIEF